MTKQMCWLPRPGNDRQKILHLQLNANDSWRPYTQYPHLCVPDHRIPGGSKGWATYQHLRKMGWTLISSPSND